MKFRPFGAQFLEKQRSTKIAPLRRWSWQPKVKIDPSKLRTLSTIGTTYGTGPDGRSDESRDEDSP